MKSTLVLFLLTSFLPTLQIPEAISVEKFKQIADADERAKLIEQAPRDLQADLRKIDSHLRALTSLGSEEGIKKAKESHLIKARGLDGLEAAFQQQIVMWEFYRSDVLHAEKQPSETQSQKELETKEFNEVWASLGKRLEVVHALLFNLAASPQALDLAKRAEAALTEMNAIFADDTKAREPITKDEWMKVDKELDEIFELMKQLPALPYEKLQEQYDNLPDEAVIIKIT